MAKRSGKKTARGPDLHELVAATLGQLSDSVLSGGSIHIEATGDGGAQFHVRCGGQIETASSAGASVRVRGSVDRIKALLNGRKHPTAVFVEGGIEVAGDVRQITAISEELPALTMKRRRG